MQKWKLMFCSFIIASSVSPLAYAEDAAVVEGTSTENKDAQEATIPVQQHVIQMMQENFSFETQKRSLSNELELAKIRSEIEKLKQESMPKEEPMIVPPVIETSVANQIENQNVAPQVVEVNKPKVLLVSQIAGVSRVAVEGDNGVKLVKLNESFAMNGKKYVVSNGQNNIPVLKETIK